MGKEEVMRNKSAVIIPAWICFALAQLTILLFLLISANVHQSTVWEPVKLFAYQLFALFFVGFALVQCLGIHIEVFTELISLSYAFGGVISLITYLLGMLIWGRKAILPIVIIEVFLSLLVVLYNRARLFKPAYRQEGMIVCIIFLILYYALATVSVSFVNTLPFETGKTAYYVDWPFWVGNNITFTKGFPIQNFRQVGTPFRYHFFSSIMMAEVSLTTSVDIVKISFYYSYIFGGLLLIFSAYFLAASLLRDKRYVLLAMLASLLTDGKYVTFSWHVVFCPIGFDYGYAYGMMTTAVLIKIVREERWKEFFLPSVLFLMMTTGCKGPIGAVVLIGFGVATLWLMKRKEYYRGLTGGVAWLGGFIFIFIVFLYSPWTLTSNSGLTFVLVNPIVKTIYHQLLQTKLGQIQSRMLIGIFAGIYYVLSSNLVGTALAVNVIRRLIKTIRKGKAEPVVIVLFAMVAAGVAGMLFTRQEGSSEMYFMMATFSVIAIVGFYIIETDPNSKAKRVWTAFTIILLILSSTKWFLFERTVPFIRAGLQTMNTAATSVKLQETDKYVGSAEKRLFADEIDYEAFTWLKDHTELEDAVACDSFTDFYGNDNSMLAGIISERYIWNEKQYTNNAEESERRNEVVDSIKTDFDLSISQMKGEGVKYFLHSTVREDFDSVLIQSDSFSEVFRNAHYVIYRIAE